MSFIHLQNLKKSFGQTTVVHDFNLAIERGEFVSFLGPSGCGKTTVLRMIAGFEQASSGKITVDGRDVTNLPPAQRKVGMVFQAYALFPNMTVADNIAFGMKVAGKPQSEITARVAEMLDLIKLPHVAGRYPYQLSGGQQQRVALARALAVKPQVLLLDEPLSALDAKIRISLREEIRAVQRALGITTIFVTHDQEEALSISDRIVVMHEGRADQIGTPFEVYNRPATRFVASFVGTLSMLKAKLVDPAHGTLALDGQTIRTPAAITAPAGVDLAIALRPEALALGPNGGANHLNGVVEDVSFLGSIVRLRVRLTDQVITLDTFNQPSSRPPAAGERVTLSFSPEELLVLDRAPAN